MKTDTCIYSTDFGKLAALKNGKIYKIGQIEYGSNFFKKNGQLLPCITLTWHFGSCNKKDVIYFGIDGKYLFSSICQKRDEYLLRLYSKLITKQAEINSWITMVQSEFILHQLEQ